MRTNLLYRNPPSRRRHTRSSSAISRHSSGPRKVSTASAGAPCETSETRQSSALHPPGDTWSSTGPASTRRFSVSDRRYGLSFSRLPSSPHCRRSWRCMTHATLQPTMARRARDFSTTSCSATRWTEIDGQREVAMACCATSITNASLEHHHMTHSDDFFAVS